MILYPAIDILDGRAVRLVRGDFAQSTVYSDDPLEAAAAWQAAGAQRLHVVDLDGARAGEPVNLEHVRRIVAGVGLPVQLGGGLRSLGALNDALAAGAERVVLGTAAFTGLLDEAVADHGEQLVVSVDVRDGRVATAGWTERSELDALGAIAALRARGVGRFVYTDVDRDGMLGGLDVGRIAEVAAAVDGELIYSGGVGTLDDLRALAAVGPPGLDGVIVGKALYEQRFTIAAAQEVLGSTSSA